MTDENDKTLEAAVTTALDLDMDKVRTLPPIINRDRMIPVARPAGPPTPPEPTEAELRGHNSGANPKDAIGRTKPGTWAVPTTPLLYLGAVMEDGAAEYGLYNWREAAVDIAVYWDAMHRHLDQFRDGEIMDRKSGLPHMAHVMANCAIIMDAMEIGNFHLDLGRPGAIDKTIAFLIARKKERS